MSLLYVGFGLISFAFLENGIETKTTAGTRKHCNGPQLTTSESSEALGLG